MLLRSKTPVAPADTISYQHNGRIRFATVSKVICHNHANYTVEANPIKRFSKQK